MASRPDSLHECGNIGGAIRLCELECRECGVVCERVVSPWRCLKDRRTCVYAFEDAESTYFGCLHKVFLPELDLSAFATRTEDKEARSDPYGHLRVVRPPRAECPVSVERAYVVDSIVERCVNPRFLREAFSAGWTRGFSRTAGSQADDRSSS